MGRQLGVNDVAIDTLCLNYGNYGLREVLYQMLKLWKQEKGKGATYRELIAALVKENLTDAADTVRLCVQKELCKSN